MLKFFATFIRGTRLRFKKKDFFGKSDPYIDIQRENLDGSWNSVYRTEVINNNLNPRWRPFEIKASLIMSNINNDPI